MSKTNKITLIVLLLILILAFWFVSKQVNVDQSLDQESAATSLVTPRIGGPVYLSYASLLEMNETLYFYSIIYNGSDVPITLAVVELVCGSETQNITILQSFDEESGRYVPDGVEVGETKYTERELQQKFTNADNCTAEVKSWSRYEGE